MKNKKLLFLSVAILSAIYGSAWATECDPTLNICETVNVNDGNTAQINKDVTVSQGDGVVFNGSSTEYKAQAITKNITVTGEGASAIKINQGASFSSNINLNGANVTSEKGTAILVEGNFPKRGTGVYVRDGAIIRGKTAAIDFRTLKTGLEVM